MGPSHFEMSAVAKLVLERMGSMMTIPMAQESTQVVKQTKQIRLFQMEIQNIQSSNLPTINPTKMEVCFVGPLVMDTTLPKVHGPGAKAVVRRQGSES